MNENTAFCIAFIALIGGCSFTTHSCNQKMAEDRQMEAAERILTEHLKQTGKLPEP